MVGIGSYLVRIWFAISLPYPPGPFPTHFQSHKHKLKFPQASKTSGAQTTQRFKRLPDFLRVFSPRPLREFLVSAYFIIILNY
jgi:hypothetical protein